MKIDILGAGAFGSSLAIALGQSTKNQVKLVALPQYVEEIKAGKNRFLPDFQLPSTITVVTEFSGDVDVIFIATPAQEIAAVIQSLKKVASHIPVVFCSKGLYVENHKPYLMTTYAKEQIDNPLHVLSGPNFAHELADLKKSFANIAGPKATELCTALTQNHFVLEPWHDVVGLQIAGCIKNVFAIACGYYEGLNKGLNEKAALFTEAFKEMTAFGQAFWPNDFDPMTLTTYGGVGDLVLTCTSVNSRNFKLGLGLAQGQTFKAYLENNGATAEGAYTAQSLHEIKGDLNLVICDLVYGLLIRHHEAERQ